MNRKLIKAVVSHVHHQESSWALVVKREGCRLPKYILAQPAVPPVVLQLGYGLERPPDPEYQDGGIEVALSFGMALFSCWIPWENILAIVTPFQTVHFTPGPQVIEPTEPDVPKAIKLPKLKLV